MTDDSYERVLQIVRRVLRIEEFDPRGGLLRPRGELASVGADHRVGGLGVHADIGITDALDAPDVDSFAQLVAERRVPDTGSAL